MAKSIRVLADASNKMLRTVNVLTAATASQPTYTQQTTDNRNWETVQDSGGTVKGLPSIVIPGYSAPA